jgi:hypothetical protein
MTMAACSLLVVPPLAAEPVLECFSRGGRAGEGEALRESFKQERDPTPTLPCEQGRERISVDKTIP